MHVLVQLGSYFGSSVCAVDLNADGWSDLMVGAPMATGIIREEGRVHVYINQGQVRAHTRTRIGRYGQNLIIIWIISYLDNYFVSQYSMFSVNSV